MTHCDIVVYDDTIDIVSWYNIDSFDIIQICTISLNTILNYIVWHMVVINATNLTYQTL